MSLAAMLGLFRYSGKRTRAPAPRTYKKHFITVARPVICQEIATLSADAAEPAMATTLALASARADAPRPSVLRVQSYGDWQAIAHEPIMPAIARRFPCTLGDLHKVKRGQPRPFAIVAYVGQAAFCFGFTDQPAHAAETMRAVSAEYPAALLVLTCDARLRVHGDADAFQRCAGQIAPDDPHFVYHAPV